MRAAFPQQGVRLGVVGTRGIPGVQGGVERHCETLYPRLVGAGFAVTVYGRAGYCRDADYRGVAVRALPAPRIRGVEALVHTWTAIRRAHADGADVIHVHSVGPGLLVPLAKRMAPGTPIVITVHAPDYEQRKWGRVASLALKAGERFGVTRADAVICVSQWMSKRLRDEYGVAVHTIPNGPGELPDEGADNDHAVLEKFGLEAGRYLLHVGRLVPDKRVEDVFAASRLIARALKVAVVGGSSDSPGYETMLRSTAHDGVVFTNELQGAELGALYRGAACLVVPSAVEGLPVTLIEALHNRIPVVASDIEPNREVLGALSSVLTYPLGDVGELAARIDWLLDGDERERLLEAGAEAVREFDWDVIARETADVLEKVLPPGVASR